MSEELTFGAWLKQRRNELGLTQEDLADRINCSIATLQKIEGGARRPSGQIAQLLAEFLHIPADERAVFIVFARTGRMARGASAGGPGDIMAQAPWRAGSAAHTNLPVVLTTLIGREQKAEEVGRYLLNPKIRLLSLTGAPGVGKTRLALQVAWDLIERFPDGVFFIDLAAVVDPVLVLPTVARTLGLKAAGDVPAERVLLSYVRERRILLVLDNFEQVLDAANALVRLLQASPWLKVLVTSREALHVQGERRIAVPLLDVPDPVLFAALAHSEALALDRLSLVEALARYPAVQLFVERAQTINPDFELTPENAGDVALVCARLEGLPLALELAAARADHLSAHALRAALDDRLTLLRGGMRDRPTRHRTLRSAVEWSYDLLDSAEQTLFRGLGVFVGGAALAAIQAVCDGGDGAEEQSALPTLDVLLALVDKSLVRQYDLDSTGAGRSEVRFGMLEALREYALERLNASEAAPAVRQRHARHFLALAQEARANKNGRHEVAVLARLDADLENLRSALDWLLEHGREDAELTELALQMVVALFYYWDVRGTFSEGREWIARALEQGARNLWGINSPPSAGVAGHTADLTALRATALNTAGLLAWHQADYAAAQAFYEAGLALRREVGDTAGVAASLNNLGILADEHGQHATALKLHEEALALRYELGDKMVIALSLNNLGVVYWAMGDADRARPLYEESLALCRELSYKSGLVLALDNLGMVATAQEDYAAAGLYQEEGLAICRELGHKNNLAHVLANTAARAVEEGDDSLARQLYREALPLLQELGYQRVLAKCFEGLAALCHNQQRYLEAARLWGVASELRQALDHPMGEMGRARYESRIVTARAQTDPAIFEAAWTVGRAMPVEAAIEYALAIQAND